MYRISVKQQVSDFYRHCCGKGGVYRVHCLNEVIGNTFLSTQRVLCSDPDGVLYIGRSGPEHKRIGSLIKSLSPGGDPQRHHAGIRYSKSRRLQEQFPFDRLVVTFVAAEEPKQAEHEAIQLYFANFGEVPPLNGNEP
jgi:hypothetical protein